MEKAFDFVKIKELQPKPRRTGLTEIRGPYYNPVSPGYIKDLLDTWGEYVDGFKFAGGSQRLLTVENVKTIIKTCHEHNVYVSTGGFIERVIIQGSLAVDRYLEECKSLGFDVVEVSSGLAPISLEDKVEIVKQVMRLGMKPKPEITMMEGAGAGTHIANYKPKMRKFKDFMKEAEMHLEAGAKTLMLESEGLTEDLPVSKWRTDIIKEIVKRFGLEVWMFEAADPKVFKWYLKNLGPEVSLFIDHSQITEYTAWRLGLWGDMDIWKGKRISYKTKK